MAGEPLAPTDAEYAKLLELRTGLRVFLRWSQEQAVEAGLTPAHHQLLLAVRGHEAGGGGPTVGEIADHLLLRRHSTTELIDRAQHEGLVERSGDPDDGRVVRVRLTNEGRARLDELSVAHLDELRRLARRIGPIIEGLGQHGDQA